MILVPGLNVMNEGSTLGMKFLIKIKSINFVIKIYLIVICVVPCDLELGFDKVGVCN